MPFIPAPGVVQVEFVYTMLGQVVETVLHYDSPVITTVESLGEFGAALVTAWDTQLKSNCPDGVALTGIKLTALDNATSFVVNYAAGLPIIGTRTGILLPSNVSLAITKRTANRGRSFRGRVYQVGLNEGDVVGNVVGSTLVTSLTFRWGNMLTVTTASGDYAMVVLSRYMNNAPRAVAVSTVVTGFTCDGLVDSQRRRLPGRGQ